MSKRDTDPPSEWSPVQPVTLIPGSDTDRNPGGVWVHLADGLAVGPPPAGRDVWVWHWHRPSSGEPRWQASLCGLHTVVSVEPLHLEASLACDEGCPNHGWLRGGVWTDA